MYAHQTPTHKQVILIHIDRPNVIFPEMGYIKLNTEQDIQPRYLVFIIHILNHYQTGGKKSIFLDVLSYKIKYNNNS